MEKNCAVPAHQSRVAGVRARLLPPRVSSMQVENMDVDCTGKGEGAVNCELLPRPTLLHPNNLWMDGLALPQPEDRHENLPSVVAIAVDPVYCKQSLYNKERIAREEATGKEPRSLMSNFLVISPFSAGWGKAPLEEKPLKHSRFLSDIQYADDGVRELVIRCFDKHESNQQYKGEIRDDLVTVVQQGCTLRLSVTTKTFEFEKQNKKAGQKSLFPDVDVIEPFTLVKIHLKPNNSTKAESNWDVVSFKQIEILPLTLYSFLPIMKDFPETLERQQVVTEFCKTYAPEGCRPCSNYLFSNGGDAMMLRSVSCLMRASYEEESRRVQLSNVCLDFDMGKSMVDVVYVDEHPLMRYTNCTSVKRACQALEIAASCGCLQLMVIKQWQRKKGGDDEPSRNVMIYKAVPLIDFLRLIGIDMGKGNDDEMLGLIQSACLGSAESRILRRDGGAKIVYEPSDKLLVYHTFRFYNFEENGVEFKREIVVRLDLHVYEDQGKQGIDSMDIHRIASDFQPYHASVSISKCCRVRFDLGPKLNPEGVAVDMQEVPNFLCMQLNLTATKSPSASSLAGAAGQEVKVNRKRSAPSMDDADNF